MNLEKLPFRLLKGTTSAALCLLLLNTDSVQAQCVQAVSHTNPPATVGFASVASPAAAYDNADGDVSTAATLTISLAGSATLNVSFDEQANPGDSVIVMFGVPTANILDWGSLGSTTFTPYSGTDGTGTASTSVTIGTLSFVITVGANSLSRIAIPVTSNSGAQSLRINFSSIGADLNKKNFIYDVAVKPGPVTATNPTICYNATATLSASHNALATQKADVLWYDSDGTTMLKTTFSQNGLPYSNTFTTPALTATKTYYVRERWNGCAILSDAKPVIVTVRPQITPAISVVCAAPPKLTTTTTNGTGPFSYLWTASAGGNIVSGSTTASPTINQAGTYSVQITDANTCTGTASRIANGTDCIALPVGLLSFTAAEREGNVLLDWAVATESNIAGFGMEHSLDSRSWNNIGFISTGTNKGSNHYSWQHKAPAAGVNYYRIKMVASDGSYSYSIVSPVEVNEGLGDLTIYPNPVQEKLDIVLPKDGTASTTLSIYTANGQLVCSKQVGTARSLSLPVNSYAPGLYFIKITDHHSIQYATKFVKQ